MTIRELLRQNRDAIVARWLDDVLATYSDQACAAFGREKDRFANPVGHALREGTRGIVKALVDGLDAEKTRPFLQEIIRIRSVQQFSASEAVSFVFLLRQAIRTEVGKAAADPELSSEWVELDRQIDRIALEAFDVFAECREKLCEVRVNEVKRRVSWVVDRMNRRGADSARAPISLE